MAKRALKTDSESERIMNMEQDLQDLERLRAARQRAHDAKYNLASLASESGQHRRGSVAERRAQAEALQLTYETARAEVRGLQERMKKRRTILVPTDDEILECYITGRILKSADTGFFEPGEESMTVSGAQAREEFARWKAENNGGAHER